MSSIVGAAFGAAGQRCMALSVAVLVGDAGRWAEDIAEGASGLKVTVWGWCCLLERGDAYTCVRLVYAPPCRNYPSQPLGVLLVSIDAAE